MEADKSVAASAARQTYSQTFVAAHTRPGLLDVAERMKPSAKYRYVGVEVKVNG